MARDGELLTEQVDDETVIYDLSSKDVHCLSPLAAAVFAQCDGRTKPSRIAELAEERLGKPVTEDEVSAAVAQLEERSLLERPPVVLQDGGISRRELARKSAKVGAAVAAVPLITSIVAPTAAMAQSKIPSGCQGCGKNPDCESNHCCQSVPGHQCAIGCCVNHDNSCHICPRDCTTNCECTVDQSDIPGGCPCLCSDPNCTGICCTSGVCCTELPQC